MDLTRDDRRDRGLLRRVAGGDRDALATLYDLHADRLFRHALWLSGLHPDASDAVQAVFVKVAGMGADLLAVRRPAFYLHRIVHTAIVDMRRKRAVRAEAPLADAVSVSGGVSPEHALERRDLVRALMELPAAQREAVILHLVEGFTFRQIAGVASVSTFTAASRYRLGLRRLRRLLAPEE